MSPFAVGVVPVLTKISPARSVEFVTMETEGEVPAPVPAAIVGAEDFPLMCDVVSVSMVDIPVEVIAPEEIVLVPKLCVFPLSYVQLPVERVICRTVPRAEPLLDLRMNCQSEPASAVAFVSVPVTRMVHREESPFDARTYHSKSFAVAESPSICTKPAPEVFFADKIGVVRVPAESVTLFANVAAPVVLIVSPREPCP